MSARAGQQLGASLVIVAALALVTAVLVAAVQSSRANHTIDVLAEQLHDEHVQRMSDDRAAERRARRAEAQRRELLARNAVLAEQIRALGRVLREHGFAVPVLPGLSAGSVSDPPPASSQGRPAPRDAGDPDAPSPAPGTPPGPTHRPTSAPHGPHPTPRQPGPSTRPLLPLPPLPTLPRLP